MFYNCKRRLDKGNLFQTFSLLMLTHTDVRSQFFFLIAQKDLSCVLEKIGTVRKRERERENNIYKFEYILKNQTFYL